MSDFRKSELAKDLSNSLRSLGLAAMSNDFLVKGTAIENNNLKKTAAKGKEIPARTTKKEPLKDMAMSRPLSSGLKEEIVNKTERQREGQNARVNRTKEIAFSQFKMHRRELQRPRSHSGARLLRNRPEAALYDLCASMEFENEAQSRKKSTEFCTKQIEFPVQRKPCATPKRQASSDKSSSSENQEMVEKGKADKRDDDSHSKSDVACEENRRLTRASSARGREKNTIKINGKSYSMGSTGKLKALNCALSRRSRSVDQAIEDLDYQTVDYEYILRFKALSRLSRICDNSVIDAVAKENSVNTVEALSLPPVLGSSWKLKDRYVSELSFNPPTPVLREYTRISQARAVDFSDLALGSQVL